MSLVAPRGKVLTNKVRELANQAFLRSEPMVYFLGANAKILAAVNPEQVDRGELLEQRAELTRTNQLKAVVDIKGFLDDIIAIAIVEVLGDAVHPPQVHTLVIWPAHQRWIHMPEAAQHRWRELWS